MRRIARDRRGFIRYFARKNAKGVIRLVTEGDSWFQYPVKLADVVDALSPKGSSWDDVWEQPPFAPLRSGPKAASRPSRQKQFPSSKYQNKRWIISFDNGFRSIVYPFPDHDAGELNIWTRNVDWHELEFVRTHLSPGASMIDAGCNVGNRTLALADTLDSALLIDAGEVAVRRTRENIALNNLAPEKFEVIHKAVGEKPGKVYFTNLGGADTGNKVVDPAEEGEENLVEIELTTIDQEVQQRGMQPAFIKIDVEGQDLNALKGARSTLTSGCVKLVMFEHNSRDELAPLLDFFKSINWKVFCLDGAGKVSESEELIHKNMNLFAHC
jgi:FkbM family methyltransferase